MKPAVKTTVYFTLFLVLFCGYLFLLGAVVNVIGVELTILSCALGIGWAALYHYLRNK